MEESHSNGWGFPNAIIVDAFDTAGTMRTGTKPLLSSPLVTSDQTYHDTRYAYVDTIISANINKGCYVLNQLLSGPTPLQCSNMVEYSEERRALNPINVWDDSLYGRNSHWVSAVLYKPATWVKSFDFLYGVIDPGAK
jgi:hypothetical protein